MGHVARMRDEKCIQNSMKGKGRDIIPRLRCEYNFKTCFHVGWIYVAQDRDHCQVILKPIMNLIGSVKGWELLNQLRND